MEKMLNELLFELNERLVKKWYPLSIDNEEGGYFTNISYDWKLLDQQEKMIVTQSRHMWLCSKAALFFDDDKIASYARHGFDFLRNKMWDSEYGGFFQIRDRSGKQSQAARWYDEKRAYGNAFGIYGLAALYQLTNDEKALRFAREVFTWIEEHAFDKTYGGYFQFLTREGIPFNAKSDYKTKASDANELGLKDQNSSIHLLEAYTELYHVWKDDTLKEKLHGLLKLIRDTITHPKGYLQLFFEEDWTPISFRDAPKEVRENNYGLDHVSFGHDYETAFLMLEASYALGLENDVKTLTTAKKMLDHAIANGWDNEYAGFYDEGYYFTEDGKCEIIKDSKTWWCQAEGLNALLLFSKIFPEEKRYFELFEKLWHYVKVYILDQEHGGWFWGGLEKQPFFKTAPKGSIWKASYHDGRALMNCIFMLADEHFSLYPIYESNEKFRAMNHHHDEFVNHWKSTAEKI